MEAGNWSLGKTSLDISSTFQQLIRYHPIALIKHFELTMPLTGTGN